jgi:DNA-binding transcriptional ArsR family regulator
MGREQPFTDQVSLMGKEADVYEAIATLEYLGRPVRTANIVSATGLDQAVVSQALRALTERGVLVEHEEDDRHAYEPAYRGWSTAPEQSAGAQR